MCISPYQESLTEAREYYGLGGARMDAWVWTCIKVAVGEEGTDLLGDGVRGFK